jgi:hypothetical protein
VTDVTPEAERHGPRFWSMLAAAAFVPIVWLAVVGGRELLPCAVLVVPASLVFWWLVLRRLEGIAATRNRLLAAIGFGLVSPFAGLALMALPTSCVPCCSMAWFAVPGAAMYVVAQPLWFFPFGLGMGTVAFLLARPATRPPG